MSQQTTGQNSANPVTSNSVSQHTIDLHDFSAECVVDFEQSIREHPNAVGRRLLWQTDSDGMVSGSFAFSPKFTYEHAAVAELNLVAVEETGWYCFNNAPDTGTLNSLLDAVLCFGRPVTKNRADFWLCLTPENLGLSLEEFGCLRNKCTLALADDRMEVDNAMIKETHNLQPQVARLLNLSQDANLSNGSSQYFLETSGELNSEGSADSNKVAKIEVDGDVYLWCMPQNVLLLQWRLMFKHSDQLLDAIRTQGMSALLQQNSRRLGAEQVNDVLRWVQSIRWIKQGFEEQVEEGKLEGKDDQLLNLLERALVSRPPDAKAVLKDFFTRYISNNNDRRLFVQLDVALYRTRGDAAFNEALKRSFSSLLYLDVQHEPVNSISDNFSCDPDFVQSDIARRTYERWKGSGVLYGYTDYSCVSVGTSFFYETEIQPQHASFLYTNITRLCLYQRSVLRRFSSMLSVGGDGSSTSLASNLEDGRHELNQFNRTGWFQEVSSEVQPEELYQLQSKHMRITQLYQGIRDEMSDAAAYLDVVEVKKREDDRFRTERLVAMLALLLGVPPLVTAWFEESHYQLLPSFHSLIFSALAGVIGVGLIIWLILLPFRKKGP